MVCSIDLNFIYANRFRFLGKLAFPAIFSDVLIDRRHTSGFVSGLQRLSNLLSAMHCQTVRTSKIQDGVEETS